MVQPKIGTQSEEKRVKNFNEVSLGYSKKLTTDESKRCPQCTEPVCMSGCPLNINIPGFIRLLREGNVAGAYEMIREQNCLPSICGRICSAPCEVSCVLTEEDGPIGIRALERYASDFGKPRASRREEILRKGPKVAIVGSGPAGLSAASVLAQKGYQVTIFESMDKPGGVLRYGIPDFRIPKKVLDQEINEIKSLGVNFESNCFIGQTVTLKELKAEGYGAILLAVGAGIPKFMDLPGANLGGVYYGEEFLIRVNRMKMNFFSKKNPTFVVGEHIVVIGSGNTALDCARVGVRYGRKVSLVFRRTEEDMRVRSDEREYGREEGVHFEPHVKPIEILADQNDFVRGIKCIRMDYAESEESGQWEIIPVPNSEFIMEADTVVIAIGHKPNTLISKMDERIPLSPDGTMRVNELTGMTSMNGVFAAGNVVTNAGPVVEAIAAGKKAAAQIDLFLTK